jgi:hypothetical protein
MIAEKNICDLLFAATAIPTYFGVQPQPPSGEPSPMPVIIVNRTASEWVNEFCGTDTALSLATIQVDYYAETAEACRRAADTGRTAMAGQSLNSEVSFYDEMSRAWRVMQAWTVTDYSPTIS